MQYQRNYFRRQPLNFLRKFAIRELFYFSFGLLLFMYDTNVSVSDFCPKCHHYRSFKLYNITFTFHPVAFTRTHVPVYTSSEENLFTKASFVQKYYETIVIVQYSQSY